jgi:hypothetical protein
MNITDKTEKPLQLQGFVSVPERIRTSDLQFRKLLLYPAELLGHIKIKNKSFFKERFLLYIFKNKRSIKYFYYDYV